MSSELFAVNLSTGATDAAFAKNHFAPRLIAWQRQHGRHDLPWQQTDPYKIWVSEIMLQQTQVATVLDYYPRFIARFPDVASLAQAETDEVTALWAGLGYYSRARNLHAAARQVTDGFGGTFPQSRRELETLKGIGRSTAAAIAAFAFHQRETILDGNVKRVLCRVFAQDGEPQNKAFEQQLWALAEGLLPEQAADMPTYTQGLMDLGATLCTRSKPQCADCPMQTLCLAHQCGLTDVLPRRKTPTKVQSMPVYWLALFNEQGQVLLQKRPVNGIWSQLYCLPMWDETEWQDAQTTLPPSCSKPTYLPVIRHKLTHRAMAITPCIIHAAQPFDEYPPLNGRFYGLQDALALALPKPLQTCLPQLFAQASEALSIDKTPFQLC